MKKFVVFVLLTAISGWVYSQINNCRSISTKLIIQTKTYLTTLQTKEIIGLFSSENSKIKIVYFGYNYVTNPSNNQFEVSLYLNPDLSKKRSLNNINN